MNEVIKYFADAFRHMGGNRGVPAIEVRFYPYAGLRHTIRLRSGRVYVRLSDICKDSPPEVLRTEQKGGVNISGVERLTVGGDIVGGNKTEMYIAGRDLFQGQIKNPQDLVAELQKLRDALGEMAKREEIDQEEVILATAQVDAAIRNTEKPDADPHKIIHRLSRAKEIIEKTTAGVGAAAGLVTAFNKAIEVIHRLFV